MKCSEMHQISIRVVGDGFCFLWLEACNKKLSYVLNTQQYYERNMLRVKATAVSALNVLNIQKTYKAFYNRITRRL